MESTNEQKTTESLGAVIAAEKVNCDERAHALLTWLQTDCRLQPLAVQPMTGDASFRRYFRVISPAGSSTVAMDAPPQLEKNCHAFIAIAHALRALNLQAPDILYADIQQGFLLMTDLGDTTYLRALNSSSNADQLYGQALRALAILQGCRDVPSLTIPPFTAQFMQQEWAWHKEWFLQKLLGLEIAPIENTLDECFDYLVQAAEQQPSVFMYRDYHSANLMVLPDEVGLLDFQDAFIGPVTYDLVSLLRDSYIDWPEERVIHWVTLYWQQLCAQGILRDISREQFLYWFDLMGVERHLKALFTFARKKVRDQQSHYLMHIPRTLNYVLQISQRYAALQPLYQYYKDIVQPACVQVLTPCAQ